MGRPIKKAFFGNLNREKYGSVGQYSGVGGEGLSAVAVSNSGTNYSQGATVTFSAPNIAGGATATGTISVPATGTNKGKVMLVTVTDSGSGYITAPTATITKPTTKSTTGNATNGEFTLTNVASVAGVYVGMLASGNWGMQANAYVTAVGTTSVTLDKTMSATSATIALTFSDNGASFAATRTLTSDRRDAIQFGSYLSTGTGIRHQGDIIKQEASRRYLVNNSQGQGQCKLVTTGTLAAGQMHIIATDWNGSTYYVKKLTANKAVLVTSTATAGGFLIANGASTGWNITAATGTTVTLANTN
jgi:hypothetical protein